MPALPDHHAPADDVVDRVLALVDSRPARLGGAHLLCIDGAAGSGKSTLAAAVLASRPGTGLVHLDELLAGWDGLAEVATTLARDVLAPLSRGDRASYRRYDWHRGEFAERVEVPRTPLLVVEGVGSGSQVVAPLRSALVWLEAPSDLRKERSLTRDGDTFAPHWNRWAVQERELFAAQHTRATADLVISTFV